MPRSMARTSPLEKHRSGASPADKRLMLVHPVALSVSVNEHLWGIAHTSRRLERGLQSTIARRDEPKLALIGSNGVNARQLQDLSSMRCSFQDVANAGRL